MWIDWIKSHWTMLTPLLLGAVSIMWLMPRLGRRRSIPAILLGLAALGCAGFFMARPGGELVERCLFFLLAGTSLLSAVCMVTSRDPVYSALWFALVTLAVCGLFLLQSAPFLAAATITVYAGAIIVTFIFVIMLARQSGGAVYDQAAEQPIWGVVASFLLLGSLLTALTEWPMPEATADANASASPLLPPPKVWNGKELLPNALSRPADAAALGTMRGLGRSLFGDYLFAVEIAGTLLMVAAIGAVAVAPRRAQGGL